MFYSFVMVDKYMTPTIQLLFDALLAVVAFFSVMYITRTNKQVDSLFEADRKILEKLTAGHAIMLRDYAPRDELRSEFNTIRHQLERIEGKLDEVQK